MLVECRIQIRDNTSVRFLLAFSLLSLIPLVACSKPAADIQARAVLSPEARIEQIPDADPQKYRATKDWRNPYLIIKVDGVALVDAANDEEHLLKTDKFVDSLAQLPSSSWPYGRVVMLAEDSVHSTGDDVMLRKNRGIVAGTLEGMHVLINWAPSQ